MFRWFRKCPKHQVTAEPNTEFCRRGCPWFPSEPGDDETSRMAQALTRIMYALAPLTTEQRTAVMIHAALIAQQTVPPEAA